MKHTITSVLAGVIAALTITATAAAAPAEEYPTNQTMTLTVIDGRSFEPVAGVKVVAKSMVDGRTYDGIADRYGRVKITGMYGDEFDVIVMDSRYHCGGHLAADFFDEHPVAEAFASYDDWGTWSARHLGEVALKRIPRIGHC